MDSPSTEMPQPIDLAQLQANLASLTEAVRTLYENRAEPTPVDPVAQAVPASLPAMPFKLKTPPEYDGNNKAACSTFISHLNLYINASPHSFPDDHAKVVFAASYLRGRAFAWLEPHLLRPDAPILHDYSLFVSELLRNMGDPDRERNTTRRLQALTQTSSAAAYSAEFFQLSAFLNWNDDALRAQFYTGLKSEVKDALALSNSDPDSVKGLSDLAIRLDNRIHERRMDQRRPSRPAAYQTSTKPPFTPRSVTANSPATSTPMEIDATKGKKFQPLTDEERKRRIDNNLCLYCGNPGHRAGQCPNKGKPRRTGAIRATLSAPDSVEDFIDESKNA